MGKRCQSQAAWLAGTFQKTDNHEKDSWVHLLCLIFRFWALNSACSPYGADASCWKDRSLYWPPSSFCAESEDSVTVPACVPTLSYRIIWLKMSTSLCHVAVPQGKRTFRSTCCEFLPPVEQTRCMVIYHINCIPTEGTYCHLLILGVPRTVSEQAADERTQRANRNTAQNTSYAVFTALHGAKIGQ